jgi:hypothetical protein
MSNRTNLNLNSNPKLEARVGVGRRFKKINSSYHPDKLELVDAWKIPHVFTTFPLP